MNVVVICSDTFRQDHLGFLGKHEGLTPNLNKLASESAFFRDFWLCSFPTLVNRIEVFSGRYTFPLFNWGPLPYEFPVLSQVFQRHGFTTALVADNLHLFEDDFGFDRGFDFVKHVPGQMHEHFQPPTAPMVELTCPESKLEPPKRRLERYQRNAYWYRQQGTTTTAEVFRAAIDWLEKPPEKFFLWIDAFDPHEPWDAPAEFLGNGLKKGDGDVVFWPKSGYANAYSPTEVQNMSALYQAEVRQIDHWVGKLLTDLKERALLDNTAVIFCSDHGYYFGEHNLLGKPMRIDKPTPIYDGLGHIPLLIRHPDGRGAGQTIPGLCQPPDLFATTLELAGIPAVPWAQAHSLVPRLNGAPGNQSFCIAGCHPHRERVSCLTVVTDEWRLLYSPKGRLDASELYHLPSDPQEQRNVLPANRTVAEQLFQTLNRWLDTLNVPPARKNQLLYNAPFTRWHRLQHRFTLSRKRRSYQRQYQNYARAAQTGATIPQAALQSQ